MKWASKPCAPKASSVSDRKTIYTHPGTGAVTHLLTIERKDRIEPVVLERALAMAADRDAELVINTRSGRAAVKLRARSLIDDDGGIHPRIRLVRPLEATNILAEAVRDQSLGAGGP